MTKNYMTIKEKEYVNYILSKNIRSLKYDVDFSHIYNFSNQKIEYVQPLTEIKTRFVFGKDLFRDNKKSRHFTSSNLCSDLNTEIEIEQFLVKYTFSKYYITNNSININFEKYFKNNRIWLLLETIKIDKDIIISILQNFTIIENNSIFKSFIDRKYIEFNLNLNDIPEHFLNKFITTDVGYMLATCLLINNQTSYQIFYKTFVQSPNFNFKEVWNFLAVLAINSNNSEKIELIKISRNIIYEIKDDKKDMVKNFIKCLGINPNDLDI